MYCMTLGRAACVALLWIFCIELLCTHTPMGFFLTMESLSFQTSLSGLHCQDSSGMSFTKWSVWHINLGLFGFFYLDQMDSIRQQRCFKTINSWPMFCAGNILDLYISLPCIGQHSYWYYLSYFLHLLLIYLNWPTVQKLVSRRSPSSLVHQVEYSQG